MGKKLKPSDPLLNRAIPSSGGPQQYCRGFLVFFNRPDPIGAVKWELPRICERIC
jgi:hypothetical protein